MNTIIILIVLFAGNAQAEWQLANKPTHKPNCSFIANATFDGQMPFEPNCKAACQLTPECNVAHGHEPHHTPIHTCQLFQCTDLTNVNWVSVNSYLPRHTWMRLGTNSFDNVALMVPDPIQIKIINVTRYIDIVRYSYNVVNNTRYKKKHRYVNKGGVQSLCTKYESVIGGLVLVLALCFTLICFLLRKKVSSEKRKIHVIYNTEEDK